MTWRQLRVLVDGLPPGSAIDRQLNPDQWTQAHAQRADEFDLLAVAHGVTNGGSKAPIRAYRPADRHRAEQQQAAREQRARAAKSRRQKGGAGG